MIVSDGSEASYFWDRTPGSFEAKWMDVSSPVSWGGAVSSYRCSIIREERIEFTARWMLQHGLSMSHGQVAYKYKRRTIRGKLNIRPTTDSKYQQGWK